MKTRNHLILLALAAAALSLNLPTAIAQAADSAEALKNRAIAASPRALEQFPWLGRTPATPEEACCPISTGLTALQEARKNRGLAASPRALEVFPELGLTPAARPEFTIAPVVEKNAALAASPRAKEEFPALSRSRAQEPGSARGGASRLLEVGK
jgi:hypothetical protein